MRRIALWTLIVHVAAAGRAHPQVFDHLQIELGAYTQSNDGGEKPSGVWRSTGPLAIGNPGNTIPSTFSVADCGYFTLSVDGSLREHATTAWRIEMTPLRVVGDAVTFRLRWVRSLDTTKGFTVPSEDAELTLRPGESRLVDSVTVPPGMKTFDGNPCKTTAASVRALVDYYPSRSEDRRLIAADLWLVERLSNGKERSQVLSVRGLPNRSILFYFDGIRDQSQSLDIFGQLTARPAAGGIDVAMQTRSRWGEHESWNRSVRSAIHLKPEEVVEVPLPKFDNAGPFSGRELSIRVRARQLR
jgi:hypothetical protein